MPHLTIGELSQRSGVAASALRYYESLGLIASERTSGNQRRYARSRAATGRVRPDGLSGSGSPWRRSATRSTTLPEGRTPTKKDWSRLSRTWRPRLDARIAELERLRDELDGCIGCGCLSLQRCALYNPGDRAARLGPGPRFLEGDTPADAMKA